MKPLVDTPTPRHWRHLRIEPDGGKFNLLTMHVGNRFTLADMTALGVGGQTDGISLKSALQTGKALEAALVKSHLKRGKPKGRTPSN